MPTDACLIPVSGKPIPTHQTIATSNSPTTTDESFKGTYLEWPNISVFVGHSGWPNQIVNFKQAARQISPLQTNGHGMEIYTTLEHQGLHRKSGMDMVMTTNTPTSMQGSRPRRSGQEKLEAFASSDITPCA